MLRAPTDNPTPAGGGWADSSSGAS
jgi:hypothetical protein